MKGLGHELSPKGARCKHRVKMLLAGGEKIVAGHHAQVFCCELGMYLLGGHAAKPT